MLYGREGSGGERALNVLWALLPTHSPGAVKRFTIGCNGLIQEITHN